MVGVGKNAKRRPSLGGKTNARLYYCLYFCLSYLFCRIVTQIRGPAPGTNNLFLGRHQYASFTWDDLWATAPWMEERVSEKINGPGLHDD